MVTRCSVSILPVHKINAPRCVSFYFCGRIFLLNNAEDFQGDVCDLFSCSSVVSACDLHQATLVT